MYCKEDMGIAHILLHNLPSWEWLVCARSWHSFPARFVVILADAQCGLWNVVVY